MRIFIFIATILSLSSCGLHTSVKVTTRGHEQYLHPVNVTKPHIDMPHPSVHEQSTTKNSAD